MLRLARIVTQAVGGWLTVEPGLLALLALMLAAGMVGGPARGLLPIYLERDLAWAPPAIAAITGSRLLASAVSAPFGGALTVALGSRRALWLGLLMLPLAMASLLTPLAAWLIPLTLAAGLADGLYSTGSQSYLVARAGRTIGLATSAFFLGSTLGGALGNLAASWLLNEGGFGRLGLLGLLAGLLVLLAAGWLPAGPATTPAPGHHSGLLTALAGYRPLLDQPMVRQLALLRFLSTVAWGSVNLLWPLLIARLSDAATAALFGTLSLTFAVIAQLVTGRLIDLGGPGRPAQLLTLLLPPAAAAAALAAMFGSLPGLFITGIFGTGLAWSLSGTMPPLMRAIVPTEQVGQVVGLLHLLWCLAMLSGTLLAGWLVTVDPALPFWSVALLNLPTLLLTRRLAGRLTPVVPHHELEA